MASDVVGSPSSTVDWHLSTSAEQNFTSNFTDAATSLPSPVGTRASQSWVKVVLLTLCVMGVVLNGFILLVLLYGKRHLTQKITSNMFIVNQSLIDFLACLAVIINAITNSFIREYVKLPGGRVICVIFESSILISIGSGASIFNLVFGIRRAMYGNDQATRKGFSILWC